MPFKKKKQISKKDSEKNSDKEEHDFVKKDLEVEEEIVVKPKKVKIIKKELKKVQAEKERLAEEEDKIRKELQDIYQDDDGTMPNMADFRKKKRSRVLAAFFFLLFACIFLGVVAWVGFFVFQPNLQFVEDDVILSISGDEEVMAGQEVNYRIRYRNLQNTPLGQANIQIRYPEGFIFESSSKPASNDTNDEWILGYLGEGDGDYIDIFGKIYGSEGQRQSFRVFLNYMPGNFSSEFQKVATLNTEIKESPVNIQVQGPEEVIPGVEVEFLVALEAKKDIDIENIALILEPGIFSVKSSEPALPEADVYQWPIEALVDSEDKIFKISGSFSPINGEEEAELIFKFVGWKDAEKQSEPYVYSAESVKVKLLKTDLSVNLGINGSLADLTVQPGETLNTSVVLKNPGTTALKNMKVSLIFETPSFNNLSMLDWQEISDDIEGDIYGKQIDEGVRRGTITWDSRHIANLKSFEPGENIVIDLSIPLKDAEDIDLTKFTSYLVTAEVEVSYDNSEDEKILSGNKINLTVNSDFAFEVRDEVTEADSGKEQHKINWILSNSFHDLENIELSVDLYGNIAWQEELLSVPAGDFNFNKAENSITWKIDKMPVSVDILALQFGLLLNEKNPTQTNLTSKVKIKATDTITGLDIIRVGEPILLKFDEVVGGEE
ncbi:MAG: hypothetical protein ABIJ23_03655, partial [Candidatus Magasanikbacteria bacterium]